MVAGRAMVLAPLVGLLLGGIAAAVVAGVDAVKPEAPLLSAVLGVVVLMGLSGALHLDGLADTADGFGSRRDRETMLRIMKQSDIGPFGVASIAGVLLIDVAALTACVQAGFGWQALLIAGVASRLTLPWSCRTTVPSARPDGLGAMVASTVRPVITYALTLATVVFALATSLLIEPTEAAPLPMPTPTSFSYLEDTAGVDLAELSTAYAAQAGPDLLAIAGAGLAVLVAVVVGALLTRWARKRLGGITGDTLGAGVELALPAALLTLALTS